MPKLYEHENDGSSEDESSDGHEEDSDSKDEVPDLIPRVDPEIIWFSNNENVNFVMDKKKTKKVQFDTTCNTHAILEDTSDSDDDKPPALIPKPDYNSNSDADSDSEDEARKKKVDEERPNVFNRGRKATKPSKARATCVVLLPDKDDRYIEYQGLLDTGSTRGLILAELVELHGLKEKPDNSH